MAKDEKSVLEMLLKYDDAFTVIYEEVIADGMGEAYAFQLMIDAVSDDDQIDAYALAKAWLDDEDDDISDEEYDYER